MTKTAVITRQFVHLEQGHPDNPKTYPICGLEKKKKNQTKYKVCTLTAGHKTNHPGQGRCHLHGGNNLIGPESPNYKHGRYSRAMQGQLAEHLARIKDADEQPADLLPELRVQRVLLTVSLTALSERMNETISKQMPGEDGGRLEPGAVVHLEQDGEGREKKNSLDHSFSFKNDDNPEGVGGGGVPTLDHDIPENPHLEKLFTDSGIDYNLLLASYKKLSYPEHVRLVEEQSMNIVKTVDRIATMEKNRAITGLQIEYLRGRLEEGIEKFIPDDETKQAFIRFVGQTFDS